MLTAKSRLPSGAAAVTSAWVQERAPDSRNRAKATELAFVTMSHLGIYLIGVGLLTPLGLAGASLLVIGDGLAKSALFLGVGVVQHQRASVSETKLRGRGRGLAVTGVTIMLGALVLADLPPYVSSAGHALLVTAAEQAGLPWLEIVIAVCVILSSGAVLRAAGRIWLGWGEWGELGTGFWYRGRPRGGGRGSIRHSEFCWCRRGAWGG